MKSTFDDCFREVEGVDLTFLDAGHCPGSAMAAFAAEGDVTVHTGDCRACESTVAGLSRWLGERKVEALYLDAWR